MHTGHDLVPNYANTNIAGLAGQNSTSRHHSPTAGDLTMATHIPAKSVVVGQKNLPNFMTNAVQHCTGNIFLQFVGCHWERTWEVFRR